MKGESKIVDGYFREEANVASGFNPRRIEILLDTAMLLKLSDEHWAVSKLRDIVCDFYVQMGPKETGRAHLEKHLQVWNTWHSTRFCIQRAFKREAFAGLLSECNDFQAAVEVGGRALAELRAILPRDIGRIDMGCGRVDPLQTMTRKLREYLNGQASASRYHRR